MKKLAAIATLCVLGTVGIRMHCRCIFNEFSFIQIYTVEFYYYAEVLDKKNSIYLLEIGSRCDTPHSIELQAKESRVNERCTWRLCAFV